MALERLRKEMEEMELTEVSRKNFLIYKKEGNVINNKINDDRFTGKKKKMYRSPDLQVMIFLQLMEIERLTLENNNYKEKDFSAPYLVNCIELDRVSTEYSKLKELHESEMVRTRELETKVFEYEGKVALISQEVERVKMLLETRSKENKTFKDELDSANSKLRFYSNAENELETLRREIERLKMVIVSKDNEVEKWKRDYTEVLSNFKGLEDKNVLLENEIHRLNNIYNSLNAEYKEKMRGYEAEVKNLKEEIERLNKLLETRDNEIEEWRVKFTRIELTLKDYRALQKKHKELEGIIVEYEKKFEKYEQEMEDYSRLKVTLHEAELKITKLNGEIDELNETITSKDLRIEELERIISEWERKLQPSFDRIKELEIKLSKLQKEHEICSSVKKKLKDLEAKETNMTKEIQNLKRELEFRLGEIEKWKYEYSVLEIKLQELQACEEKMYEYEEQKDIMASEISRLNSEIRARNETISVLKIEISRLQMAIKEFKGLSKNYEEAEARIEMLSRTKSDADSKAKGQESEFSREKDRLIKINVKLKGDIADLRSKLSTANQKVDSLKEMNEGISGDLAEKCTDYLKLKRKFERLKVLMDKFREMEGKFIDSEMFIKEFRPLLVKYFQLESDSKEQTALIAEYQSSVSIMKQEIVRLKSLIHSLEDELQQSKSGHSICELRFKDYEERLSCLGQEIERLQVKGRMRPSGMERTDIESISQELHRANTMSQEKEERIVRLNEVIDKLKIEISERESRIISLEMDKKTLNQRIASTSNTDFVRQNQSEQELIILKEKEVNLNSRIASLTQELETVNTRLQREMQNSSGNQNLQSEITSLRSQVSSLETKIVSQTTSMRELETLSSEKQVEIQNLQTKISSLQTQVREAENSRTTILQLEEKISFITQENERLRISISDKEEKIRLLETSDSSELEMKIGFMSTEIERLKLLNNQLEEKAAALEAR